MLTWWGTIVYVAMQFMVAAQFGLAWRDGFGDVAQMQRHGVLEGLPIRWHFGIWEDCIAISGLVAVIVSECWSQWTWNDWDHKAFPIAVAGVVIFQLLWMTSNTPEAHMQNHRPTAAGYVHDAYFVIAAAMFIMLYFYTPQPPRWLLITTSIILPIHVWVGSHMLLGVISCFRELQWYPDRPLRNPAGWATVVVLAVALWWRTSILLAR